jgi:hypothetical protein
MNLTYTSPEENTIKVTLDEGETWSDMTGPTEAFVPTDPDNRHYQDIVSDDLNIAAYEAPIAGAANG